MTVSIFLILPFLRMVLAVVLSIVGPILKKGSAVVLGPALTVQGRSATTRLFALAR